MNILVSLISKQTLPNVLYIKGMKDIDKYLFVSTPKMEENDKTSHIIKAANIQDKNNVVLQVDEYSIKNIEEQISKEVTSNDTVFVNITGGTKIMSMAIYNYFLARFNGTKYIIYLPFGKNIIQNVFPQSSLKKLKVKLNIMEYMQSYNINVLNNSEPFLNYDESKKMLDLFVNKKLDESIISFLRDYKNNNPTGRRRKDLKLNEVPNEIIKDNLKKIANMFNISLSGSFPFKFIRYLIGEWLEEFSYFFIKEHLNLTDDEIFLSSKLSRNNEIDIMFVYENNFYIIECKTSLLSEKKFLFNDTVYKLQAISKDMGLSVNKAIFTTHYDIAENKRLYDNDNDNEIRSIFKERLNLMEIKLFDITMFKDIEKLKQMLLKWVKKR